MRHCEPTYFALYMDGLPMLPMCVVTCFLHNIHLNAGRHNIHHKSKLKVTLSVMALS
jgi:hypothetical protein